MQNSLAYRDGEYLEKSDLSIGTNDLGFERGFAVFDYMRERNGNITFLKDHLQRLDHSQSILNFQEPILSEEIKKIILQLEEKNKFIDSYYKAIISGKLIKNTIQPVVTVYSDNIINYPAEMFTSGISLIISEFAKPFPEYKTTFYLGSYREYTRMHNAGAEDVLFYFDNIIRECSRCNVFTVKNNLIYTPAKNMLQGITRKHAILCAQQKYIVIEKDITVKELFEADEVFLTSTTKNIMPVVNIEDAVIADGKPGYITKELMEMFQQYCLNYSA